MKLKTIRIVLSVLLVFAVSGCRRAAVPNESAGTLQIKGSDTIVNAEQKISEEFMKAYPEIFVAVTGGGSGVGIASLINKTCDIAAASREIKPDEVKSANDRGVFPHEIVVAYDGVAVIVNNKNPVEKLTIEQLHRIFTGKATNWKEFGGADLSIVRLSREVSSGTHIYFKEHVVQLGKKDSTDEFSVDTLLLSSSQAIVEEVANNEAAVGYLGMGYVSGRTKTLQVGNAGQFFMPDVDNVTSKKYPLSRPLYFFTNGQPTGITKLFLDFTLGPIGQKQFEESGFVPFVTNADKKD